VAKQNNKITPHEISEETKITKRRGLRKIGIGQPHQFNKRNEMPHNTFAYDTSLTVPRSKAAH
jgi:hypothetical protein